MKGKSPKTSWNNESAMPKIAGSAFIHDSAVIIGDVHIKAGVHVCPGAVIRADEGMPISIGENSSVEDNCVIHSLKGKEVSIGERVNIAHASVIHGPASIGDNSFVGFGSVVYASIIGKGCIISHNCTIIGVRIPDKTKIPSGITITSSVDVRKYGRPVMPEDTKFAEEVIKSNNELAQDYKNNENAKP